MKVWEKSFWRMASIAGTVFTAACLVVSLWQFFVMRPTEDFTPLMYVGVIVNSIAFFGFVYILLNPVNFAIYAFVFYVYGLGNILDNGHALGFVCVFTTFAFMYALGVLSTRRALKITLLSILPLALTGFQFYREGVLYGMITVMHLIGLVFMLFLVCLLFCPRFEELKERRITRELSTEDFSTQDVDWLTKVLSGKKYVEVAHDSGVSESKVKTRMLELYQMLGVHDRTEFLMFYHNSTFVLSDTVPSFEENRINADMLRF